MSQLVERLLATEVKLANHSRLAEPGRALRAIIFLSSCNAKAQDRLRLTRGGNQAQCLRRPGSCVGIGQIAGAGHRSTENRSLTGRSGCAEEEGVLVMARRRFVGLLGFTLALAGPSSWLPAAAADIDGSRDHPMVSRYAGAEIIAYGEAAFDSYPLLVRKALNYGGIDKNRESTQAIEGKVTRIGYRAPTGRSTLEVYRNYEAELKKAGFETIFACTNADCGGRNFNHAVTDEGIFSELYGDQRYLASRLKRANGDVYGALYVALGSTRGGPPDTPFVKLDLIETRPMQTGMVTVDAAAMEKGLSAEGRIALYNIYFDTDAASLKPESKSALEEIAKLMQARPQLALLVVGHTDSVGDLKYNVDLSERRARAVVQALTGQHGVAATRLSAAGVGMYSPVASNKSEAGRARNRRVELVER
jgi:outer membrane protein OmpA-like peptidoglycan-associated protein